MSSSRRRTQNRSQGSAAVKVMTLNDPSEYGAVEKLIRQGPVTLILVFSPTCPHCHTYMPLWKELQKTPNKQANMVTMEASVFDQTPLSEEKQIEGVPSVLYVNTEGKVSEVSDIRNTTKMSNLIQTGSEVGRLNAETLMELSASASEPTVMAMEQSAPMVIPGEKPNPLPAIPAMTSEQAATMKGGARRRSTRRKGRRSHRAELRSQHGNSYRRNRAELRSQHGNSYRRNRAELRSQHGGNPWAALVATAGPAALLAGAYGALPARSSGLLAPRHSAKWRRIRARLTRRHKKHRHF